MEENPDPTAAIDRLRRQRAHKRGLVTKLLKKIQSLDTCHPDDLDLVVIDGLSDELSSTVSAHNQIQAQINDLVLDSEEAYESELVESERHDEIHTDLRRTLRRVRERYQLWSDSNSIVGEMKLLLAATDTTSPRFEARFQSFISRCTPFLNSGKCHRLVPAFRDRFTAFEEARDILFRHEGTPLPTPASASPSSASTCSSGHNALRIEVPSFDGDPEHWEQFESLFVSTIKTRAKGYSPMEVRGLLRSAVKPDKARRLLDNLPHVDCNLEKMMAELKSVYGAPNIVCPILTRKIQSVSKIGFDFNSFTHFHDNFCLPWRRFISIAGTDSSHFLATLAVQMMTEPCRAEWMRSMDASTVPCMEDIIEFTKKWLVNFNNAAASSSTASSVHSFESTPQQQPSFSTPKSSHRKPSSGCVACGEFHGLTRCDSFRGFDVNKRNLLVREKKLCINCFSHAHGYKSCPNKFSCKTCGGRHHTMLHHEREKTTPPTVVANMSITTTSTEEAKLPRNPRSLYTAVVIMENGHRCVQARALLDGGASIAVMSERLAMDSGLTRVHERLPVEGLGGVTTSKFGVMTRIQSRDGSFTTAPIAFTVIPSLKKLDHPTNKDSIRNNPAFSSYLLADPELGGEMDLILPLGETSELTTGPPFCIEGFLALPTRLGLCLSGPTEEPLSRPPVLTLAPDNLQDKLSCLWELDRVPESPALSQDDVQVVEGFEASYKIDNDRFYVSLPRIQNPSELGDTRRQAMSRLFANERSLTAKDKLVAFSAVMTEYLTLDHAEVIPKSEVSRHPHCYLPVHGVFKETSTTTKVRAVFDASARSSNGVSLNDTLLAGPNLYPPLVDVLTRFRRHFIAMSSDISKMFREIMLHPGERDWHRFLMRGESGQVLDCRMKRVTFGVKCSPFLATQVLRTLADLHSTSHPTAATAIREAFYVDDFLYSTDDLPTAMKLRAELCDLLSRAGMVLRKWRSNSKELLQSIPPDLCEKEETSVAITPPNLAHKALGIHWDTVSDSLFVAIPSLTVSPDPVTKRVIASGTAGVFDVLGLFCPAVVLARILFQDTWKLGLAWDKPVPEDLRLRWDTWITDLPAINAHPVPRRLCPSPSTLQEQLHGFCDASTVAYGAAIYLRTIHADGTTTTTLVMAKARVLPVHPITVPRAELTGAVLLAELLCHCSRLLDMSFLQVHAWTDSEILLHWIPKTPTQLDRFVSHRIYKIQQLLPGVSWRHVTSEFNPADLASRGMRGPDLAMSALWWSGPPWLSLPQQDWPRSKLSKPPAAVFTVTIKPCLDLPPAQKQFLHSLWS